MNFMLGLGARQLINGGAGHDQLGVRGAAGRALGAAGPDLIYGGAGRDRIRGLLPVCNGV
jgi:Ca2+-binding RTX toxin-like protein